MVLTYMILKRTNLEVVNEVFCEKTTAVRTKVYFKVLSFSVGQPTLKTQCNFVQ